MKACVILMFVICAAVIVKQSEGQTIEDNPVYKCLQKNPTNNACYNPGGTPRAANKYTRGCSETHRCRGRRRNYIEDKHYDVMLVHGKLAKTGRDFV
ncbi:unnamed protein product [Brassica oleracea var. botrytis]